MEGSRKNIHERFHQDRKIQKSVIDNHSFTYLNLLRVIASYIGKSKKILDIGCGVGTISFFLAQNSKIVTGIDISDRAIKLARTNAKTLGLTKKTKFKRVDFPDQDVSGKYDLVLLSEVLEHLRDDNLAVEKVRKMLEPGGIVVASSPSKDAPLYRVGLLKQFDKEVGHLRRYSEDEFKHLFRNSGFTVLRTYKTEGIIRNLLFTNKILGKSIRFIKWIFSDLVNFIDSLTIPVFGESQIYLIAKKK